MPATFRLLHGTTRASAVWLLAIGFVPDTGPFGRHVLSLTDNPSVARWYAAAKSRHLGSPGVVLAVDVRPRNLRADRAAYEIVNNWRELLGLTAFKTPRARDWRTSLSEIGSVVTSECIAPINIEIAEPRVRTRPRLIADRRLVRSLTIDVDPSDPFADHKKRRVRRLVRSLRGDVVASK